MASPLCGQRPLIPSVDPHPQSHCLFSRASARTQVSRHEGRLGQAGSRKRHRSFSGSAQGGPGFQVLGYLTISNFAPPTLGLPMGLTVTSCSTRRSRPPWLRLFARRSPVPSSEASTTPLGQTGPAFGLRYFNCGALIPRPPLLQPHRFVFTKLPCFTLAASAWPQFCSL